MGMASWPDDDPFTIERHPDFRLANPTRSRWRRRVLIAGMLIGAFFVGMCVHSYGVPGHTQNGGFTLQTPWFSGGVEIWGSPGFFSCYQRVVDGITVEYGC